MSHVLNVIKCIVVFHTISTGIESAKILCCFPSPTYSHQMVFRAITLELIKRGHQVTVITANPIYPKEGSPYNLTEINIREVAIKPRKYFSHTITGQKSDVINEVHVYQDVMNMLFEEVVKTKEVTHLLKYQKNDFNLLLLEAIYTPFLGLTHIFKAPTVLISSLGSYPGHYELIGAPTHLTLYSIVYSHKTFDLSLWDKIMEIFKYLRIKSIIRRAEEKTNNLLKNILGSDMPTLRDLKNNVDMLFLNVNPIWENNHPVPPCVIHMGGIHLSPPKKLSQDLQRYLDESSNGVIYFSLGTNVNTSIFTEKTVKMFTKTFSQLPYNILWKWDSGKLPAKSKNIKTMSWLPQADVLRHKNLKMFITQGGLQSTDEAITAGVPLIGIPMLADQWYNVDKYVYHKIGIRLDFETITKEKLLNAVNEVAKTESYRNNIIRLRSLMLDQPQSSMNRTIWWIEYVLRHGGARHLRAPAANISWSEFLELELVSYLTLLIFTSILFVFLVTRFFTSYVLRTFLFKNKVKIS